MAGNLTALENPPVPQAVLIEPVAASVQVDADVCWWRSGWVWVPVGFSIEQQDQLWEMWRGRRVDPAIERAMAVSMPRIQRFLRQSGGVRPLPLRRRECHLAAGEREKALASALQSRS